MKKLLFIMAVLLGISINANAQNIIIQQNNQQQKEKVIVQEKEVPVYIRETNPAPQTPVCLYGYLYVYPEDIGRFAWYPSDVVNSINKAKAFGRSNWRLPTLEELNIIQNNVSKLGVFNWKNQISSFYMHQYNGKVCVCNSHTQIDGDFNYCIRLVSTD